MPTHKLNWIQNIQVKSSNNASNNIQIESIQKIASAKHIFLPYLNSSEKSETIHIYRGQKVEATVQI